MKFKVGDKVKFIKNSGASWADQYLNCMYIILKINNNPLYKYQLTEHFYASEDELELVEEPLRFKVGDLVTITKDANTNQVSEYTGRRGIIKRIYGNAYELREFTGLLFKDNELELVPFLSIPDNVNSPSHYTQGKIQPITFIEDQKLGFCLGNVVKYICRHGKKNGLEDLKKAKWYLEREIKRMEEKNEQN